MFEIKKNKKNKSAVILNPERSEWVLRSHVTSVETVVNDRAKTQRYSAKRDLYASSPKGSRLKMTRKALSFLRLRSASGAQGISTPASCREAHKRRFIFNPWILRFAFAPLRMTMLALVLSISAISESWAACVGATATTAGTDEENKPCGTWDCGAQGSNVTCTLAKGTLTISGEGAMKDYVERPKKDYTKDYSSSAPWSGGYITKAVIEGNVTRIGTSTFEGELFLTEISGMESVKVIGQDAFDRCSGLTSIDIPNVTEIEAWGLKMTGIQYINMRDDVILNHESLRFVPAMSSCTTNPETGMKTCGSCGDKYVKSGTGCVTADNCGDEYYLKESTKQCLYCPYGKVVYKEECLDEYPFAKKRYTPAEAAQWLNEDNNTVTLTFKK